MFAQTDFTRARRSTNYEGGRKYDSADKHRFEKGTGDPAKAELARISLDAWKKTEVRPVCAETKAEWKEKYG